MDLRNYFNSKSKETRSDRSSPLKPPGASLSQTVPLPVGNLEDVAVSNMESQENCIPPSTPVHDLHAQPSTMDQGLLHTPVYGSEVEVNEKGLFAEESNTSSTVGAPIHPLRCSIKRPASETKEDPDCFKKLKTGHVPEVIVADVDEAELFGSEDDDLSEESVYEPECDTQEKHNEFIDSLRETSVGATKNLVKIAKGDNAGSLFGLTQVTAAKKNAPDRELESVFFSPSVWKYDDLIASKKEGEKPKKKAFFVTIAKPNANAEKNAKTSSLPFCFLSDAWDKIGALVGSGGNSSKKQTVILSNLLRLILYHSPMDFIPTLLLCQNKVAADYEGVELGVGDGLLMRCISETYGRSEKALRNQMKEDEDLGRVAENSKEMMTTLTEMKPLTIQSVFASMKSLPTMAGNNAQGKRKDTIRKMLMAATGSEPKYIVRFCQAKMRIGMQVATIYASLACCFSLTPRKAVHEVLTKNNQSSIDDMVRKMLNMDSSINMINESHDYVPDARFVERSDPNYMTVDRLESKIQQSNAAIRAAHTRHPNMARLGAILSLGGDYESLTHLVTVTCGIPLQPMLAKPTKGIDEVFSRLANVKFTCEYKYDGERAQIHYSRAGNLGTPYLKNGNAASGASIKIFSRNLENMSEKYPDLVQLIDEQFSRLENSKVQSAIFDSEVVAYDTVKQTILPFQILTQRKRKDVQLGDIEVQVCVFLFDCIHFNNESLIDKTLIERRDVLRSNIATVDNKLELATSKDCDTFDQIDEFLNEAIQASSEGLMIKTTVENATYQPSKRSLNWLKLKKDYLDDIGDSLDLVVMGAYNGTGKRCTVYGAFLLGVYDAESGVVQTVCKAGTGFSDADLKSHYEVLGGIAVNNKPANYMVHDRLAPDVYFTPKVVWEVRCGDINISPVHQAAMGVVNADKGIGLRFPRFVRIREDKTVEMATNTEQLADMYYSQAVISTNR